ncbi:MAG: MoxR family ATPase [Bdellovibrionales bacterium]|nr:MoxR family ATPase [Bdellovibrionales bacterium]
MSSLQSSEFNFKRLSSCMDEVRKVIVGQNEMLEACFIGLLTEGHILIEGLPGLAKTLTISSVAQSLDLKFQRVQFTPDLLPTDIIGTMIYQSALHEFKVRKGPVFTNILLADEVNRAPAKVQSALLEAMGEKQVTISDTSYPLEKPFLVLATQNPLEHEGTYPLPEAQMDRFLFKILVHYPSRKEEEEIFKRMSVKDIYKIQAQIEAKEILEFQKQSEKVYLDDKVMNYMLDLIMATRDPALYGLLELKEWVQVGASPRATIGFPKACRARAFLNGKDYVTAEDVKAMAYPILRHRLILTYEAQAENISPDDVIELILKRIRVP